MKKKSDKEILGNDIETVRDIGNRSISSNYRGSISFNVEPFNGNEESILDSCPTRALSATKDNKRTTIAVDHGKCIMCGYCSQASPEFITIQSKPASPTKIKKQLSEYSNSQIQSEKSFEEIGNVLREKIKKMFGRSLAIREVDAGSCNGCEIEITALNNPIYDIERFGIHFVASPRHADVLLVTGPASKNMEIALLRTYEATPSPKIVIAVGACACSGGIFGDTYATTGGIDKAIPVDVYIPGCPPRPEVLIQGLLLAVDRMITNGK
ncbi:NADH-quinone oxidoreductase subunit B family protein [Candidatus Nitrosotalea bavarica]|uniref:NADH-quinone oxidoreductase subunit B family protein n=1 Tax=Candidatus Nitrosotalea bavarica TaxID=1903277 RepID=UPI000C7026FD|nr:NADH-quinone oxidoreductase subunit B family protein [Candidatus Nitrosotalea bavarica]